MKLRNIILVLLGIFFGGNSVQTKRFTEEDGCASRMEMTDIFREEGACDMWTFKYKMCKYNFEVTYVEAYPYVFRDNTTVRGILPGK